MALGNWLAVKLNPAQRYISSEGKIEVQSLTPTHTYQYCYENLEIVNRGVNMLVDDVCAIPFKVGESQKTTKHGIKKKTLEKLLNVEANPYQDINSFRRALMMDFLLDGNMFIYHDGVHLYHVPAAKMTVVSDAKTFISGYKYDGGNVNYDASEIIHIKDNSYKSIFRGNSRLEPSVNNMNLIIKMVSFQDNFFTNGAVPGLVIETPDTLNERLKDRLVKEWTAKYRPGTGGKRPLILDGGMKISKLAEVNFKDLDFHQAIGDKEDMVLKSLGIPPLLLDSGNNANIRPNHRLYYLETIIPIINKITAAYQHFFGFEVYEDTTYIEALRPELVDQASYLNNLVNGGIISPNEARFDLGREPKEGHEDLRIPANIAGSAVDPSQGGRPKKPNDN